MTFTVLAGPSVSISSPASGAVFSVIGSSGKATVPYAIAGSTPSGTAFTSATGNVATLTA